MTTLLCCTTTRANYGIHSCINIPDVSHCSCLRHLNAFLLTSGSDAFQFLSIIFGYDAFVMYGTLS